jgi:spore protease
MNRNIRTDLAIELRENAEKNGHISGVKVKTIVNEDKSIKTTIIDVINQEGALAINKDEGTYITIESDMMLDYEESIHDPLKEELQHNLKKILKKSKNVMVVGLGNRQVTPDCLGPLVVDNLYITRHLEVKEKPKFILSAICPGVMAQTGIETVDIIRGICKETGVDTVVAVDALAARSSKRLGSTIQLTDTGIGPGSGVGNNRKLLNTDNLGVKVVAVGVPTVISVPSIIDDSLDEVAEAFNLTYGRRIMKEFNENERYQLASNLIDKSLANMFVTPKNIDELVKRISYTISEAINAINV